MSILTTICCLLLHLNAHDLFQTLSLPNRFDSVLNPTHSQSVTYDVVAQGVIGEVVKGYNGAVLCYGQTGTGKTYTMFGESSHREPLGENISLLNEISSPLTHIAKDLVYCGLSSSAGVVPRAVHALVDHVNHAATKGIQAQLSFSFLEIYCESISDLFRPTLARNGASKRRGLQIREDPVYGIYVAGLTQIISGGDAEEVVDTIDAAASYRATHATAQNSVSSRSHAILQFTIEQCMPEHATDSSKHHGSELESKHLNLRRSTLTLVDLAGSERVAKSRSEGQRLEEAKTINKSISALGNCVAALAEGRPGCHVPFRDSKLTRLLTDTLGGNAKSCICATVTPESASFEETNSTLVFAARSMAVRHHAVVNEMVMADNGASMSQKIRSTVVDELLARNAKLESEMSNLRNSIMATNIATPLAQPPPPPPPPPLCGQNQEADVNDRSTVHELAATIESLQQQLAQKNLQIAQLQHQSRNHEKHQVVHQEKDLVSRVAKALAGISPLRSTLEEEFRTIGTTTQSMASSNPKQIADAERFRLKAMSGL